MPVFCGGGAKMPKSSGVIVDLGSRRSLAKAAQHEVHHGVSHVLLHDPKRAEEREFLRLAHELRLRLIGRRKIANHVDLKQHANDREAGGVWPRLIQFPLRDGAV